MYLRSFSHCTNSHSQVVKTYYFLNIIQGSKCMHGSGVEDTVGKQELGFLQESSPASKLILPVHYHNVVLCQVLHLNSKLYFKLFSRKWNDFKHGIREREVRYLW